MTNKNDTTRAIELAIDVAGTPEQVWQALTEGPHIAGWFAPEAKAGDGQDAEVWFSWGGGMEWSTKIARWEPGTALRWLDPPMRDGAPPSAMDWTIEAVGGKTRLRLVHSGFGTGADWDEQYDALKGGWSYFIECLAHYIRFHFGTPRQMVSLRPRSRASHAETWDKLVEVTGLNTTLTRGDRYTIALDDGTELIGEVVLIDPPRRFAGTVENANNGHFFVEFEGADDEGFSVGMWLSTWAAEKTLRDRLQRGLGSAAERIGLVVAAADMATNVAT